MVEPTIVMIVGAFESRDLIDKRDEFDIMWLQQVKSVYQCKKSYLE